MKFVTFERHCYVVNIVFVQYRVRRNRDGGFGFSISGGGGAGRGDAVRICRVDALSHAWQVGLEVGDELLSVDSISVTLLPVNSVAAIIRSAHGDIFHLQRFRNSVSLEHWAKIHRCCLKIYPKMCHKIILRQKL